MRPLNLTFPEGDSDEAVEFIDRMYPGQPRHLVAMPLKGRLEASTFLAHEDDEMRAWIEARQGEANLYFHVNGLRPGVANKKATKDEVSSALFVHVDIDDANAEERVLGYTPPPTVIAFSGGGYHVYWKLKEPTDDLVRIEAINMAMATALGGDKCHNIDRIMRLPGTVNIPNAKKLANGRKPALARIVKADWSLTYSLDDFPQGEGPEPAGPKGVVSQDPPIVPVDLDALPFSVPAFTRALIQLGDDPERPRDRPDARFRSRSEVVFRVACDLGRSDCSEAMIAGVLINPAFGIARSILEKKRPIQYALRQARSALAAVSNGWPDCDKYGAPRSTMRNTVLALQRLEFNFSHDLFRHRKVVNGSMLDDHVGEISDDACAMLRKFIIDSFGFDPKAENVRDAVTQLCLEHTFHPIRQMLDALVWDGVPRVGDWLVEYMGADDTPLNRAIGRITLVAAVRRVREPGVKFDTIPILEGKQGTGKSTALRILAGPGNHSDNELLTLDTKAQMEAMEGVWIYELSEMSGLNKSEVERMKAFASRDVDRARMSYARFSEARGRQTIFIGTTNEHKYLKDRTGNRRFLPVKTGVIDLEALARDRDQLWAEAAMLEAQDETIVLPQELWAVAAAEQEERLEDDPWQEKLAMVRGKAFGEEVRALTADLLVEVLGIPVERQHNGMTKRVTALMRELGWEPAKFKVADKTLRGFRKPKPDGHVDDKSPIGSHVSF
ncbi:VapE domain-containing protein [Shinella fusca]|uniref:Putative P-loop ATPase n=1 Tax=Shinella fusca TaxID=544480 RepID=A0A7W8DUX1_9HYPH|nr:VapE domain-containing protein [Shinella fusca]MBB5043459.1 putative P-loop ATPase [Shinella fusca]